MPVISIVINEIDHQRLEQEHAALCAAWPSLGRKGQPPTFAVWLGSRVVLEPAAQTEEAQLGDIRVFNAIERLVTSLPGHGFNLAHTGSADTHDSSSQALAQAIVEDFKLQPQYTKRLQELFVHYLKTAREIADAAQVGITNRAYGALTEAHRKLTSRTSDAINRLGPDKAVGRIEGATAILVSLDVMDVATAKKRTSAFKAQAGAARKTGWVGKMFGEN